MNYLQILSVISTVVAFCTASPACVGILPTITKCVTDNGLDVLALEKQTSIGAMDAKGYKQMCAQLPRYTKAVQCIGQEFNRCSLLDSIIPMSTLTKMSQSMGVLCNDPKINFDCLAQVSKQQSQIETCVTSKSGSMDLTKPKQQITCDSANISIQCTIDILKTCDQHTANVFEKEAKTAVSC